MSNKQERRFLESDVKLETREANQPPRIVGYAAVFGKKSHNFGDFVEVIDAHAFDDCLASDPDIVGLFNHDDDMVLGRTSSGTMKVYADGTGLKYEIDPPATSYANDLMVSMSRGDIRSSSFAFYAQKEKWTIDPQTNENVRTLLKARVVDCSVVTNGAYPDASSQLRCMFPDGMPSMPNDDDSIRRFQRYMHLRVMSLTPRRSR
jgi:HK97 family phage prohead protease